MSIFDPEKILVIPLKKKHQVRIFKLIQTLSAVSLKGGGRVPISVILKIAHWDKKPVGERIRKSRGDLILKSREGHLQGTFMNSGKPLTEAIDKVPMMQPEIIIGKRIDGFFQLTKRRLVFSHIRGISVHNTIGDNALSFTYKIQKIIFTPRTVTVI